MKQKIILGIAILILSTAFLGCQKNASTDIPEDKTDIRDGSQPDISDKNPSWLNDMISEKKNNPVENPPASIEECMYKDNIAYHVSSPCCDEYNYLYDKEGEVICAPDGGITGKGDGKCPDFSLSRDKCKTIWEDSRTYP